MMETRGAMDISSDFFERTASSLGLDPGVMSDKGRPDSLLARGLAKHREAMADLPAEYSPPESYDTLADWLAANPNPRQWARAKARELLSESRRFRELGMDLGEATHWLAELAHKWKRMAEDQIASQLPENIGANSGMSASEVVADLALHDEQQRSK